MPSTPPHRPRTRARALRCWSAWWLLLAVLCAHVAIAGVVEAEAAAASGKKSTNSTQKKSTKKTPAKKGQKANAVKPVRRDVSGPQAVPDGGEEAGTDSDGEEDVDDEGGGDTGDPESELEAIERELLAQPDEPEPEVSYPEPSPPVVPSKPFWDKHTPIPGETLEDIARRYQVPVSDLEKWNGIKASAPIPAKKKLIRVLTTSRPAPREQVEHVVKRGDTWDSIAKALGVDRERLRRWNPRLGDKLDPKKKPKVVAWRDLDVSPMAALTTKLGQIRVRAGGYSIGKPNRGRLVRGVELPDRPDLYLKRKPDEAYGSTHTVMQTLAAITRFRHESGYRGQVVIGAMSRPKGGRFRPHKSHQSGRDIDIRLPLLPSAEGKKHTTSADVDWKATWKLMRAFLDTGEVEYVFLDYRLQKRIYKVAREAGVSREQLDAWLEWPIPVKKRANKRILIRHVEGHTVHMHVRIRCGANEKHCYSSR